MSKNKNKPKFDPARVAFKFSLALIIFILGGVLAMNEFAPFKFLKKGYKATEVFVEEKTQTRPMMLKAKRYKGEGVTVNDSSQTYNGLTLIQGWFPEGPQVPAGPQARLLDMEGKIVHSWKIDFFEIWKDPKHIYPEKNIPKTPFNYHTQGMVALPDGSIVVNIGNSGTVKLDKCSQVVWTVDRMTHHSVTRTKQGGFWIPANQDIREIPKKLYFNNTTPARLEKRMGRYENLLLHIDANGEVTREFSVLQAIADAGMEHQLYDALEIRLGDPTHVNDIEVVTEALASKIDGVNEGDLIVSIRQFHMLAIFDKETGTIKWTQEGPWVRQHDIDITAKGNVTVYNNRYRRVSLKQKAGSNIMEFDPSTRETKIIYPKPGKKGFYSAILGTQQGLANGNWLINESRAGRVLEVNPEGDIVWEFLQAYNKQFAALIELAERYDSDYFTVDDWSCPES